MDGLIRRVESSVDAISDGFGVGLPIPGEGMTDVTIRIPQPVAVEAGRTASVIVHERGVMTIYPHHEKAREWNVDHGDAVVLARPGLCREDHGTTSPCDECTMRAVLLLALEHGDSFVMQDAIRYAKAVGWGRT